jgi:hypothetical protein
VGSRSFPAAAHERHGRRDVLVVLADTLLEAGTSRVFAVAFARGFEDGDAHGFEDGRSQRGRRG